MSYSRKWRPSASQRRDFAIKMQDPEEQAAYEARKRSRIEKRQSTSRFDYESAGGNYVPTEAQHDFCVFNRPSEMTPEQEDACNIVAGGYICQEKVHHDYIHIVNELMRHNN